MLYRIVIFLFLDGGSSLRLLLHCAAELERINPIELLGCRHNICCIYLPSHKPTCSHRSNLTFFKSSWGGGVQRANSAQVVTPATF